MIFINLTTMNRTNLWIIAVISFCYCHMVDCQASYLDNGSLSSIFDEFHLLQSRGFRDYEEDSRHKKLEAYKKLKDKSDLIQNRGLSQEDHHNLSTYNFLISNEIFSLESMEYLIPMNAEGGFYNNIAYTINSANLKDTASVSRYAARLKEIPKDIAGNIGLLKIGITKGVLPPKLVASKYKLLTSPFMEKSSRDNLLMKPFYSTSSELGEKAEEIELVLWNIILNTVIPAYEELDSFMQNQYIPACNEEIGAQHMKNGKAYYEQKVKYFTTLDLTPEIVFEMGLSEVERIKLEMDQVIKSTDFKGSFAEFVQFLRTDPGFYPKTPRELIMQASYFSKKIDGKLPEYFNKLPRLPYGVEPVPEAIAPYYTMGRYSEGSEARHRAGAYWINTHNLESRPLYVLPALTLHEAVPGHHLQIALSREMTEIPSFRKSLYLSAFGEGWGLYAEFLGKEMGIYEDQYQDFGRLTYEMWRACRLVVDVGMHYKDWTREDALHYLIEHTALSIHECNTEIDRYIGWPGQALAYKIGELKIKECRQKAEKMLGKRFDIRTFHDAILENGSVPLFILDEVVDDYIQENSIK